MDLTDNPPPPASRQWLASLGDPLWIVYLTALAVAVFAFVVSYTHIYDLGYAHAQSGIADRLLPLSVDLLIVAASLVMFRQSRDVRKETGLARWLPRIVMWSGIAATVGANVAYGLPHGWLAAVISGWPGAAFVGVVEMVMIAVRPGPQIRSQNGKSAVVTAGQSTVPSNSYEAAAAAYAASLAGGNPLSDYQLSKQFGITRGQARKIVGPRVPKTAVIEVPAVSVNGVSTSV